MRRRRMAEILDLVEYRRKQEEEDLEAFRRAEKTVDSFGCLSDEEYVACLLRETAYEMGKKK